MKAVTCHFKNIDTYKVNLNESKCLMLISIGGEAHEGSSFSASLDLINISFNSCVMSMCDTLQRYTMALNRKEDPDFFRSIAVKEGDLWIERNSQYFDKLSIPNQIFRWDYWLNHPHYIEQRNKILSLMDKDASYRLLFDSAINKYVSRYYRNLTEKTDFNIDRAKKLCLDYLIEECTVLCLWSELGCHFEIYSNFNNEALEETRKRFIYSKNPNILNPLMLGFKNAKHLNPQKFKLLEKETAVD